ncbi:MAG: copper-translocating P-type ATPase [Candidatus Parcubacteria bacterium]|nr:MAG: copper-translocating P-type ATPase [Candidatus Parcubacteria bacterium]
MGCLEPQDQPGNCPVCGMKLVEVEEKYHKKHKEKHEEHLDKHQGHRTEDFLKKFWLSLILTIPIVLYSDIFQKISNIKLPSFEGIQYLPFGQTGLIMLLGSIVFFYGGFVFLVGAYREIKAKNPGMMTLIALAVVSAYVYSVFAVLFKIGHEFFWELATLITIMLLGHYFEMKSVSSAQRALQEIEKLLPDIAELEDGRKVKLDELKLNDIVIVRPGGKIPADGIVIEGKSEVNESMITGESKPVLKEIGSEVIAGTINGDGVLKVKVTKIGEETFLAGIKRLIKEAQASKSKLQVLADVFAKYLTFIAIGIGSLSFIIWLLLQKNLAFALERLVTVLIVACPHALGLAVPLVVAISTSLAIHNGFLIRNRLQLELARKIDVVLFDKTGTLTSGRFKVREIITRTDANNDDNRELMRTDNDKVRESSQEFASENNVRNSSREGSQEFAILQLAASLNQYSQHFIAQGILEKAKEQGIKLLKVEEFENLTGRGVKGKINGKTYYLGGNNLLKELGYPNENRINYPNENQIGTTVYLIDENKNLLGAIVLEDEIQEESFEAVKNLHQMGIKVAMITGDKKEVAEKVAKELGIDEYFAEVLPEDKVNKVKELQKRNLKVMMVGDGINDAPALMQADVGVAIGAGTNVAIESAGIILVRNDPRDIVKLIELSRKTYRKMIENLFWATGYNIVALPLAAGILAFKGIFLSPALAAIFMSLSTVIVAVNALGLRG